MYEKARYLVAGDKALVVEFGNQISEAINGKVRAMSLAIDRKIIFGITEIVPTYRSIMVYYNPAAISYGQLLKQLQELEEKAQDIHLPTAEVTIIPTLYGGDYGPDMVNVMQHNQLSQEDVIRIHSSRDYLIYMFGFTPGFPYLGGMDERIATPRLLTPRVKIKCGSVGIAGSQTGIYSIDGPGGWQLIGWTPVHLYDPDDRNPILLKVGNYVRFEPISEEEYWEVKPLVDSCKHQRQVEHVTERGELRG